MLTDLRCRREGAKSTESSSASEPGKEDVNRNNLVIYQLVNPLLAKSSAIMSVIVDNGTFANVLTSALTCYTTPLAVMSVKGIIL